MGDMSPKVRGLVPILITYLGVGRIEATEQLIPRCIGLTDTAVKRHKKHGPATYTLVDSGQGRWM